MHSHHPRQRRNGMCSLKTTSRSRREDETIPLLPGVISGAWVRFMFGKTSLALAFVFYLSTHSFTIHPFNVQFLRFLSHSTSSEFKERAETAKIVHIHCIMRSPCHNSTNITTTIEVASPENVRHSLLEFLCQYNTLWLQHYSIVYRHNEYVHKYLVIIIEMPALSATLKLAIL